MTFRLLGCTVLILLWVSCSAQNIQNDCGPPPRIQIEELVDTPGEQSYSHGDIVFYKCRPGYITLGRIRYRCNNGNWEKPFPAAECRKKSCGHPGDIMSGSFDLIHGDEFVFGTRVVYRCDEGYQMLSQTNYRDCRVDGWSNDVPHCEVRKCLPVKEPENGRIIMTGIQDLDQEFLFGQVVRFECDEGLKLKGSEQIFCTAHGNWSASVPNCVEIICEPEDIEDGSIIAPKALYRNGDRLQFSCDRGYKHAGRGDATCTQYGWSTRLACIVIVCLPPQVQNGNFRPSENQYRYEDVIQLRCDRGYQGSGQVSKCTESGWIPPPKCMQGCDYPRIENGKLDDYYEARRLNNIPVTLGHSVQFSCDPGFLTQRWYEAEWAQCTRSGWRPYPKCFKICRDDVQVPHGRLQRSYWPKTYLEGQENSYSCEREYSPTDPEAKARCTKDGWSPNPLCAPEEIPHTCEKVPVLHGFFFELRETFSLSERVKYRCQGGFTTLEGQDTGVIQCLAKGWEPEPKCVRTCSKPSEENVIFHTNKSVFLPEDILNYECKDGYETLKKTSGDQITCTENRWVPNPGCQVIQCEALSLENGAILPRNERYFPKDVVRFSCNRQYHKIGPSSTQCYDFGWSPQSPTCKEKVSPCQPPPDISNGTMVSDPGEEYQHGEMVEYECNLKFIMSGSKKIVCVDGEWTSLPSCTVEEKVCGPPPNITNGYARSNSDSDKYFHGETVNYECEQHFVIVGTNPAKCLYGEWELPSCVKHAKKCRRPSNATLPNFPKLWYDNNEVVTYSCDSNSHETKCANGIWLPKADCKELCPLPPHLPNAINIAELRNYENGEEIIFRCKDHFRLQGPETISCEGGKWQTPPKCIDLSCGYPPTIDHGEVMNSTQRKYLPGESVQYRCREGFSIGTQNSAICKNMAWSQPPSCTEKQCGKPPRHTSVDVAGGMKSRYPPGATVHYKCRPNLTAEGPLNVTCQRGAWSKSPTCRDARCLPPPSVPNSQIYGTIKQSYLPFEKVKYRCTHLYSLSGPPEAMCLNKQWTNVPRCIDNEGKCDRPPGIENGDIRNIPKREYLPDEWVRYQCQSFYIMEGSDIVRCVDGHWTDTPRCIDRNCQQPPTVTNADIMDGRAHIYPPGHQVHYQCHEGFEMPGSATITCENKKWSQPPRCEDARCLPPPSVPNSQIYGTIKQSYLPFEKVKYRCTHLYSLSGPPEAMCLNKQWTNVPRCIDNEGKCDRPPGIENGDIRNIPKREYLPDEWVRYQCQSFYIMEGSDIVRCVDGHWTDTPRCIVPCTATEEDMRNNNISLKWTNTEKLYSESGDKMEFICRRGYRYDPASPPLRATCIEGKLEYPRCVK